MKNTNVLILIIILASFAKTAEGQPKQFLKNRFTRVQLPNAISYSRKTNEKKKSANFKTTKLKGRLIGSSTYFPITKGYPIRLEDSNTHIYLSATRGGEWNKTVFSDTSYMSYDSLRIKIREIYTYNSFDSVTYGFSQIWDDTTARWYTMGDIIVSYIPSTILKDTIRYRYWDELKTSWINTEQYIYEYDAKGNQTLKLWFLWDTAAKVWNSMQKNTYTYDAKNNLKSDLFEFMEFGSWRKSTNIDYTYDLSDNLINSLQKSFSISFGVWLNHISIDFTYDASGNQISSSQKNAIYSGTSFYWNNVERHFRTYNIFDSITSYTFQRWSSGMWRDIYRNLKTYDSRNNLLLDLRQEWDGLIWDNDEQLIYTYDAFDNRITQLKQVYDYGLVKWHDWDRKFFKWNSYKQLTQEDYQSYNWTKKIWEYEYSDNGISNFYYEDYDAPEIKPVVDFKSNATKGFTSTVFNLTDESKNNPTSWEWTITPNKAIFIGTSTASSQNPSISFSDTGWYSIKLVASNKGGADSLLKTKHIYIEPSAFISNISPSSKPVLFPNPVNGRLMIQSNKQLKNVFITNVLGQSITLNPESINNNIYSYSTNNLIQGIYVITIENYSGDFFKDEVFINK